MLLGFFLIGSMVMAQQAKNVTGSVRDVSGQPLAGITVQLKGKTTFSTTDEKGIFSIAATDNDILVISGIGFENQEIKGSTKRPDITMVISRNTMTEVVVTALGVTRQKRQLGYSVTNVKGSELAKTNELNPINLHTKLIN